MLQEAARFKLHREVETPIRRDLVSIRRYRFGFTGVALAFVGLAVSTYVAFAATTPFSATFNERTTFQACPPDVPPGSRCFSGVGHGPTTPPGDPNAVENFSGFVTPTGQDFNVVSIATNKGTLFLTTAGVVGNGGATESGTWTAHGGTGIFEDASGSGPVNTVLTGVNPDGSVNSLTNYGGTLNLRSE